MPDNLEAKVVFVLDLSEAEIQAIDEHPAVKRASQHIRKALEAITGWRMQATRKFPARDTKQIYNKQD